MILVAAALIMAPSYLARILSRRIPVDVSVLAVAGLGLFLIGVFLLVKVLRD